MQSSPSSRGAAVPLRPSNLPSIHHQAALSLARRLDGHSSVGKNAEVRAFWKGDYLVFRGAGYGATLRMLSDRTLNTECIAKENRRGRHLGTGAIFLYRRGDEYAGSFPLWDWELVPGTTLVRDGDPNCAEVTGSPNSTFPPSNTSCWVDGPSTDASGERGFVGSASHVIESRRVAWVQ